MKAPNSHPLVFATTEEMFNELCKRKCSTGDFVFTLGSRLLIGSAYGPEELYELGKELIMIAEAEMAEDK